MVKTKVYGVINNSKISHVVYSDSNDVNKKVVQEFFPDNKIIEQSEVNGQIHPLYDYDGKNVYPQKPFESWVWNDNSERWMAPCDTPQNNEINMWNEETKSWEIYSGGQL
jgi:hypothetical protein